MHGGPALPEHHLAHCRVLPALDFHPMLGPASLIGVRSRRFDNQPFQTHSARGPKQVRTDLATKFKAKKCVVVV
jgi:hypothetical protein